jgi:hypothetical protein
MSSFVYRWPFFFWLTILLGLAAFLALKSAKMSSSGGEELKSLVDSSPRKIRRDMRRQAHELTQQQRHGVTKQVYVAQGPLRRSIDINAASSTISIVSDKPHMRVVEVFYDVTGLVQHELYYVLPDGTDVIYDHSGKLICRNKKPLPEGFDAATLKPKQHFRYFEANQARYDFHTSQLHAEQVKFWTFTSDGHEPMEDPFVLTPDAVGEASRMTFYVSQSDEFSAEFLNVQFTPEGGI